MSLCQRDVRFHTLSRAMRGLALGALALSADLLVIDSAYAADDDIRLATIGYLPARAKVATILGTTGSAFVVKSSQDDATALSGTLSESVVDPDSKQQVRYADFSSLEKPGSYYLEIEGVGRSLDFVIAPDVYREQLKTVMLGFYGWRSGPAVQFTHRGQVFKQGPGHLQDGLLDYLGQAGVARDGSRGWYDAGDYGKYTVNGAFALGMMLKAWEMFPTELAVLELAIPEHGGSLPDFLDELKWEFDWLETMQYSDTDGRVSHKLTSLEFAEFIMPEADVAPTYYSPYGSAAVADFVAAMAMGARTYRPFDAALADRMLAAAKLSYAWLTANAADTAPNIKDFKTGAYTTTDSDDRLWAAAEMWETTGDAAALSAFESRATTGKNLVELDFDWGSLRNLGVFTYLLSSRPGKDSTLVENLRTKLLQQADTLVSNRNAHGYGRALTKYYWGSNGSVARTCMMLQVANRLQSDVRYVDACADQIAHLYGRNAYNRSYVTGEGKDPPLHPHHRPSAADGVDRPFPGLLVGGSSTDAKGWEDVEENYEVNEVAVNWNAALVFALAGYLPPSAVGGAGGGSAASGAAGSGSGGAAGTRGVQSGGTASSQAPRGGAPSSSGTTSAALGGRSGKATAATNDSVVRSTGGSFADATSSASATSTSTASSGCECRVQSWSTRSSLHGWLVLLLSVLGARSSTSARRKSVRRPLQ